MMFYRSAHSSNQSLCDEVAAVEPKIHITAPEPLTKRVSMDCEDIIVETST